ncbi:MAG: hypothetical protein RMK89_03005 [Armatimonadota bacterium]|nr:hypothetical protein [Armatimonadota bacterium]MDW8142412.1 hypothetical protein [Armatimonadota bacterium]
MAVSTALIPEDNGSVKTKGDIGGSGYCLTEKICLKILPPFKVHLCQRVGEG